MVFKMVRDSDTERQAVERIFDYMGSRMWHFTGDLEAFRNIFAPYTVAPYSPQPGWGIYVAEAGSPSMSGTLTGTFRAVGLKAKQFLSPDRKRRAGSVEADGPTYYYDGNNFSGSDSLTAPVCSFFLNLYQVEGTIGNPDWDDTNSSRWEVAPEPPSSDRAAGPWPICEDCTVR